MEVDGLRLNIRQGKALNKARLCYLEASNCHIRLETGKLPDGLTRDQVYSALNFALGRMDGIAETLAEEFGVPKREIMDAVSELASDEEMGEDLETALELRRIK